MEFYCSVDLWKYYFHWILEIIHIWFYFGFKIICRSLELDISFSLYAKICMIVNMTKWNNRCKFCWLNIITFSVFQLVVSVIPFCTFSLILDIAVGTNLWLLNSLISLTFFFFLLTLLLSRRQLFWPLKK